MKTRITVVWALVCFLLIAFGINDAYAETVKIGVLAKDGAVKAMKMWKATGDYLTAGLQGKEVEIVPLGFEEVNPAIEEGKVDFFLVNSSMFITAKIKYGATEIATMINSRQGEHLNAFGGVIFTLSDNDEINSLEDLKGKHFMAVEASSFGGWQMAYKELLDAGIDPYKDFSKLEFGGKHDNVVLAVLNEAVDAGTVRTDTLERMAAAGDIDMDEFKIINVKEHEGFPFVCSTALYPEWPLAKLKDTPDELAREIVSVLKQLKPEDEAAKNAKIVGWSDPLDYSAIADLQEKLKIGAFAAE
jgi:twitching motility protein PilJ